MTEACLAKGLTTLGFTEHAPRPPGYIYPEDYQDKLERGFGGYCETVRDLAREYADRATLLLGAEIDFFPGHDAQIRRLLETHQPDFALGGVHFVGPWGFDFAAREWRPLDEDACFTAYREYYALVEAMAASGLFHAAAHLDLVKIFSMERHARWLASEEGRRAAERAVDALARAGMVMEISSAGLRKPCKEIYPGPLFMDLARERETPICFGSDAHAVEQVAFAFDKLEAYAREAGFDHAVRFTPNGSERYRF